MEVANLPSEDESSGSVTKRLLQGRPLPAILVDNHPTSSRYAGFRPHQRRSSMKSSLKDRDTSCDSGISFSSPEGDPPLHMSTTSKSSVHSGSKFIESLKKKKKKQPAPAGGNHVSSTSSGISSGRAPSETLHRKPPYRLSRMTQHGRSTYVDGADYTVNPDPVPFLPQNFIVTIGQGQTGLLNVFKGSWVQAYRSSTVVKKIPIPKRHQDTFGGYEYNFTGQRGVMLHTDRYQFEALRSFEGLNQRDRLIAEMEYMEYLRTVRRRRELVPHRTKLDLVMGGKKIEFEERFDINREIQKLKAIAMPQRARDLYHGKGIILPPNHMSIHPRLLHPPSDIDSDEDARVSAPASLQRTQAPFNLDLGSPTYDRQISLTLGDIPHTRSVIRGKRHGQLPSLKPKPTPGLERDSTSVSKAPSLPNSSRSAAWVQEQNQLLPRSTASSPESTLRSVEIHLPPCAEIERRGYTSDLDLDREETDDREVMRLLSADLNPVTYAEVLDLPSEKREPGMPALGREHALSQSAHPKPGAEGDSETYITQPRPNVVVPLEVREDSTADKRRSPEAPPPTTEGGPRPAPESGNASPQKSHTPNPLKTGLKLDVPADEETNLRQTFQRLDTDADGHLQYHQLRSQLPQDFPKQHEDFVKMVYNITSSSASFFGVDEFLMMTQLTNRVASLKGRASEAYGKINFDTLEGSIIKYVDMFHKKDSSQKGKITLDALRDLLSTVQDRPVDENSDAWNAVLDSIEQDFSAQVTLIEYLAHIPLFMELEPSSPPPQTQQ